jgi:hypothetical protein
MSLDLPNPPEPKKIGHRWIDLIVAISALSISLVSILVARHTSETMERLARASFWPFVQVGSGNVNDRGEREIALGLSNVGTGPARIHAFEVRVDGQSVSSRGHLLTNILRVCCNAEFQAATEEAGVLAVYGEEVSSPVANRFLAPNDEIAVIRWPRNEANASLWAQLDRVRQEGRITTSVCYCSVFDECWVARTDTFPPEEVDSCTPDEPRRNEP